MAKTKAHKQLDKIFRDIVDSTNDLRSSERLRDLGDFAAKQIVDRTRKGFGVSRPGGNRGKLKRLSKKYIAFRKKSKLDNTTSPAKSNLTFTGQLLRSIKVRVRKDRAIIGPSGRRYDGKRNEQVSIWVEEQGRPYLFLGRAEQRELVGFYRNTYSDIIKKRKLN